MIFPFWSFAVGDSYKKSHFIQYEYSKMDSWTFAYRPYNVYLVCVFIQGSAADIIKIAMIKIYSTIYEDIDSEESSSLTETRFQVLKGRCRIILQVRVVHRFYSLSYVVSFHNLYLYTFLLHVNIFFFTLWCRYMMNLCWKLILLTWKKLQCCYNPAWKMRFHFSVCSFLCDVYM